MADRTNESQARSNATSVTSGGANISDTSSSPLSSAIHTQGTNTQSPPLTGARVSRSNVSQSSKHDGTFATSMTYDRVRLANQVVPQVQVYFQLCDQYRTVPCAAITIALQYNARVSYLQLEASFGAEDMLPLAHILKYNKTITSLDFRRCQIGNHGAYILGEILTFNDTIRYINLSDNDIGEHGTVALAKGLDHNRAVQRLLLRGNRIGVAGATALSRVVCTTTSLQYLDVSNNSLRVYGVQQLVNALQIRRKARQESREHERAQVDAVLGPRPARVSAKRVMHGAADRLIEAIRPDIEVKYSGNLIQHEVYNSIIHGIGLVLSIVFTFPLIHRARMTGHPAHVLGVALYCVGLVGMYLSSTLGHSLFFLENTSEFFHIIDKNAIYALIAGTYSPFLLVNLSKFWWSRPLLLLIWALAIAGIVMSTACGRRFRRTRLVLYLIMGWAGIVPLKIASECFHPEGMLLLCGGGLIYSLGVFFYLRERLFPTRTQGVWYLLVVLASAMHFCAVYFHTHPCPAGDNRDLFPPFETTLIGSLVPASINSATANITTDTSLWHWISAVGVAAFHPLRAMVLAVPGATANAFSSRSSVVKEKNNADQTKQDASIATSDHMDQILAKTEHVRQKAIEQVDELNRKNEL